MFSFVFFGLIGSHVTHSQIGQFGTTHNCTDHHEQSLKLPLLLLITSLLFQEPPPAPAAKSSTIIETSQLDIVTKTDDSLQFVAIFGSFTLVEWE